MTLMHTSGAFVSFASALLGAALAQGPDELSVLTESAPLPGPARRVFVAPDGAHIATLGADDRWFIQSAATALDATAHVWSPDVEAREGDAVRFSKDGRFVAWMAEGAVAHRRGDRSAAVVDVATGAELTLRPLAMDTLRGTTFRLDAAGEEGLRLFGDHSRAGGIEPAARLGLGAAGGGDKSSALHAPTSSNAPWWTSPDGARIAVALCGHATTHSTGDTRRFRRAEVVVISLMDGSERSRHVLSDEVTAGDPGFPAGLAIDVGSALVARVRGGRVHVAQLGERVEERCVFGADVTAIAWDNERGWVLGTRDGAIESWRSEGGGAPTLRSRTALRIGAIESFDCDAGACAARGALGYAVQVEGAEMRRDSAAFEVLARGPFGVLRDERGAMTVVRAGAKPLAIEGDRPEYKDNDTRVVRAVLAGQTLAWLEGGHPRVLDLSLPDAQPRALASLHAGRIEDVEWRGQGVAVRGPRGWEALGGAAPMLEGVPRPGRSARIDDALQAASDGGESVAVARRGGAHTALSLGPADPSVARRFELQLEGAPSVRELAVGPGGRFVGACIGGVVLGTASEGALYFDTAGRLVGNDPAGPTRGRSGRVGTFGFSSDGRYAVAAKFDRRVTVRDLAGGEVAQRFEVPREAYSHFAEVLTAHHGPWYVLSYPERDLVFVAEFPSPSRAGGLLSGGRIEVAARGVGGWSDGRVDFLPGHRLVTLEAEGVTLRRLPDLQVASRLDVRADFVRASPDGRRLALVDGAVLRIVALRP